MVALQKFPAQARAQNPALRATDLQEALAERPRARVPVSPVKESMPQARAREERARVPEALASRPRVSVSPASEG